MELSVVVDKLSGLTTLEIANYLKGKGIKGQKSDGGSCPLSNYFYEETSKRLFVSPAGIFEVSAPKVEGIYPGVRGGVTLDVVPESISDFISQFDSGIFPYLEESN